MLIIYLIALRLVNILLVQTSFVPDEYWQSVEVAHNCVFGTGHLTWEWQSGIRSFIFPGIFSILFKLLQISGLDNAQFFIFLPRAVQAILSAISDWCLYKFASRQFGKEIGKFTICFQMINWFCWYCATRTLINTTESALFVIGIYFFPCFIKERTSDKNTIIYMFIAVILSIVRPTAFISWLPLVLMHLKMSLESKLFIKTLTMYISVTVVSLIVTVLVDKMYYGSWIFVPYNFFHFNFLTGQSSIFGTHPFHWYLTQGIWVVLGPQFPLCIFCSYAVFKSLFKISKLQSFIIKMSVLIMLLNVFVFSLLGHKEFRFIMTLVPLSSIVCGVLYSSVNSQFRKIILIIVLVVNLPAIFYFGLVHQRGTLDIVNKISGQISLNCENDLNNCRVLFLMPCHSTPFYSHIHYNVSMKFLECPPNINNFQHYKTEQDIFYENPSKWLKQNVFKEPVEFYKIKEHKKLIPKYLTFFDSFYEDYGKFEYFNLFKKCDDIFHTHFPEDGKSRRIYLLCRK